MLTQGNGVAHTHTRASGALRGALQKLVPLGELVGPSSGGAWGMVMWMRAVGAPLAHDTFLERVCSISSLCAWFCCAYLPVRTVPPGHTAPRQGRAVQSKWRAQVIATRAHRSNVLRRRAAGCTHSVGEGWRVQAAQLGACTYPAARASIASSSSCVLLSASPERSPWFAIELACDHGMARVAFAAHHHNGVSNLGVARVVRKRGTSKGDGSCVRAGGRGGGGDTAWR